MSDMVTSVNAGSVNAANLTSDILHYSMIGQAKRAPHWGVQSKFRVIYMCRSVGRSVCRSVGPSVGRSVGPSVGMSVMYHNT